MAKIRVLKTHASYLDLPLNDPREILRAARPHLAGVKFDTIVGTGLSGALVVPMLARALRKKFAIVRKGDDRSTHSTQIIEGTIGERWVFVDDLVCSGDTLRRVQDRVKDVCARCQHTTRYVGLYLYVRPHFEAAP